MTGKKFAIFVSLFFVIVLTACGTLTTTSTQPPTHTATLEIEPSQTIRLATASPTLAEATTSPTLPQPSETPIVPTETPTTSPDPVWDRIQSTGKIIIGTSADYPPFEYYNDSYEIIGFDADLARQLASHLNLQVELVDVAFEGLPAALQIGQIDAAMAAISITPERQAVMDFTNVYFGGQDSVLARQGSWISSIVTPAQLAQYRVGVQRGSIYASWIQDILIEPGLMPETNLLRYAKAGDAVRDLLENRNDLVVLDKPVADEYIVRGGVVSVGKNLNSQLLAIALPKGSPLLQAALNEALITLQNNGTIARLTNEYLNIQVPEITPTPLPTATPIPGPTATPVPCYDGMQFVSDVEIPDGTVMRPGEDFDKVWRIRNTGTCTWNRDYRLVFVQGDRMDGTSEPVTSTVRPGETYDMVIDQRAPSSPGKYTGIWQMINQNAVPFGERVWVKITVPGAESKPTPIPPTATSIPPVQPTLAPGPVIHYLNVNSETIRQGEVVVVRWAFTAEGLLSARLTRTNPDGSRTMLNNGADVDRIGRYEDLLMNPGRYSYTLNLTPESGSISVETIVVNVTPVDAGSNLQSGEWVTYYLVNPVRPNTNLTPLNGTELTINFNQDGSITGFAGCNPFSTTYTTLRLNRVQISDRLVVGIAVCDQNIMGQEDLYLQLLTIVEQFEIVGDVLYLRTQNPDPNQNQVIKILQFARR